MVGSQACHPEVPQQTAQCQSSGYCDHHTVTSETVLPWERAYKNIDNYHQGSHTQHGVMMMVDNKPSYQIKGYIVATMAATCAYAASANVC